MWKLNLMKKELKSKGNRSTKVSIKVFGIYFFLIILENWRDTVKIKLVFILESCSQLVDLHMFYSIEFRTIILCRWNGFGLILLLRILWSKLIIGCFTRFRLLFHFTFLFGFDLLICLFVIKYQQEFIVCYFKESLSNVFFWSLLLVVNLLQFTLTSLLEWYNGLWGLIVLSIAWNR